MINKFRALPIFDIMHRIIKLLICIFLSTGTMAQSLVGAWESFTITEDEDTLRNVLILADGFQVYTIYNSATGEFIHSNGGTWKLEGDIMTEMVEFHTDDPERVGSEVSFQVIVTDETIEIAGSDGRWVKTRSDWKADMPQEVLEEFNRDNAEILKRAGYL